MTVTMEALDKICAGYNATVTAIRSDAMLSGDGKRVRLAAAWTQASAAMQRMREANDEELRADRERLQRKLFASSPGSMAEYRDALAAASATEKQEQALELLERARLVGDTLLEKAVGTIASERGWTGVVNDLAAKSPERAADLLELSQLDAALNDPAARLHVEMAFILPDRPEEIAGLSEDQLATLQQDVAAKQSDARRQQTQFRADLGVREAV